jgi:hypothetical protein
MGPPRLAPALFALLPMLPVLWMLPLDAVEPEQALTLSLDASGPLRSSVDGRVLLSRGVRRDSLRYKLLLNALATRPE